MKSWFIDVDEKIKNAESKELKDFWESKREFLLKTTFIEGWDVDAYMHECGHYEILQIPLVKSKESMMELVKRKPCTKCVLGLKNKDK